MREAFLARSTQNAPAFALRRPGHGYCDFYELARHRLAALGVERVYGVGFDTFTDMRFYSYRRATHTGRFASLVRIRGDR